MKRLLVFFAMVALSLVASGVLLAQSDPRIGTWKLDAAKSTFENQTYARKSETRTYESSGNAIKVSSEMIRADGSKQAYGFDATPDGKDYPYTGYQPGGAETLSTKRVGDTFTAVSKKGGKALYTTTNVVSKDGKALTLTTKGTDANGQNIGSVRVYNRQ
jgi:hypothetical protein